MHVPTEDLDAAADLDESSQIAPYFAGCTSCSLSCRKQNLLLG